MDIKHKAWMIEEAERFCKASEILWSQPNLSVQAQLYASLSLEILFKSFGAEIAKDDGEIYEKYQAKRGHDLITLADELPSKIKNIFGVSQPTSENQPKTSTRILLERYRVTFLEDRYMYEARGNRPCQTQALTKLSRSLIDKTITLYKETNCSDPFIENYPNV